MIHWADEHVEWIRARLPELRATPFYVLASSEVHGITEPNAVAWTNSALDVRLRPTLEARGQWLGRGVAIIVESGGGFFAMEWPEQLGIMLHETAHWVDSWDSPRHRADFQWTEDDDWLVQPGNLDRICVAMGIDPVTDAEAAVVHHGATYTRAALHLWWRCRCEIGLDQLQAFSPDYRSPNAIEALAALDNELRAGGDILGIMRTSMPEPFAKLWQ